MLVTTYTDGTSDRREMPQHEAAKGLNAMQAAPIASNIMTAAALNDKNNKFDFKDYALPLDDSILRKKDISPMLRDIDRMVATGRAIFSERASSTSQLLAGLANLTAVGMAETGKVRNDQYQDYAERIRQQELMNLEIASKNSNLRAQVDAANLDLKKERLSLLNSAATETSKLADSLRQEGLSKHELEQMYLMYPYLNTLMPK